jgi:hypothetical protein
MSEGPLSTSVFKVLEFVFFFGAILGVLVWQYVKISRDIAKDERDAASQVSATTEPTSKDALDGRGPGS